MHVILRGGAKGPNYAAEYVRDCGEKLLKAGLAPKIMVRAYPCPPQPAIFTHVALLQIDCSHGNSSKQHQRQIDVAEDIVSASHTWEMFSVVIAIFAFQARQLESGDTASLIMGVMIESNIAEGRQDIPASGKSTLKYGQSVTDACISWEQTVPVLDRLREGVRGRRNAIWKAARGLDVAFADA